MSERIVQIGCGKMGEIWAESFYKNGGNIEAIIDDDPRDETFCHSVDSNLYSSLREFGNAGEADIWCISTPVDSHFDYIKKGIEEGISKIFVEKPATRDPEESEELLNMLEGKDTSVYVDYIETQHPSVRKVLDDIDDDFILTQAVHWRGKDLPKVLPHLRDDMVHDFSEIMELYKQIGRVFSNISLYRIGEMKSWEEVGKDSKFSDIYDVSSSLHLEGDMGEPILLKGGYNEESERRYFCWVDDVNHKAYFVSTLVRKEVSLDDILKTSTEREKRDNEEMSTFAVKVEGATNTDKLIHNAIEGSLTDMEDFKEVFNDVDAERIVNEDSDNEEPDSRISEKIMMGETCPLSLKEAVEIENKVKEIYSMSEGFESMYEEERDRL